MSEEKNIQRTRCLKAVMPEGTTTARAMAASAAHATSKTQGRPDQTFQWSRHHVKDSPVVLRAQFGTFRLHPSRRSFVQKMVWLVGHNAHARMPEVFCAVCVAFEPVFHIVKMRRVQLLLPPTK